MGVVFDKLVNFINEVQAGIIGIALGVIVISLIVCQVKKADADAQEQAMYNKRTKAICISAGFVALAPTIVNAIYNALK